MLRTRLVGITSSIGVIGMVGNGSGNVRAKGHVGFMEIRRNEISSTSLLQSNSLRNSV